MVRWLRLSLEMFKSHLDTVTMLQREEGWSRWSPEVPSNLNQSAVVSQRAYIFWRTVKRFACRGILAHIENSTWGIRQKKSETQALLYNCSIDEGLLHIFQCR